MKKYEMLGSGDCYTACVASLLSLPEYSQKTAPIYECENDLHHFLSGAKDYEDGFFDRIIAPWVESLGYHLFSVYMVYDKPMSGGFAHGPKDYVGIFGVSNEDMRRLKVQHAVIGRGTCIRDGESLQVAIKEILHDPCVNERDYDRIEYVDVLQPVGLI